VTASSNWLLAARKLPLWLLITMPTPIPDDDENTTASTLMIVDPSCGVDQLGTDNLDSHLWTYDGLNRCSKIILILSLICSARLYGCFLGSSLRTSFLASHKC
jgi:hypothetical protein